MEKNINDDIKYFVEMDFIQKQALDYCRVIGNNSVHIPEIDVNDSIYCSSPFDMINLLLKREGPKHITSVYNRLPESARKAIENVMFQKKSNLCVGLQT